MFAYRNGSTTAPTAPAAGGTVPTWNSLGANGNNTNSSRFAWATGTGSSTSGTWTNATHLVCLVFRGCRIGASAGTGGSGASISYPALTLQRQDSTSWVAGVAGHRAATNVEGAPGVMTNRTSVGGNPESAGHDTNGGASGWSATSVTVNANSGWRSWTAELRSLDYPVAGDAGSFSVSGNAATLARGRNMVADLGQFSLTGAGHELLLSRLLPADARSFALAGYDTTFQLAGSKELPSEAGVFLVASNAATLLWARPLSAGNRALSLSLSDAGLLHRQRLIATTYGLALSGQTSSLSQTYRLAADAAIFSLITQSTSLRKGARIGPVSTIFALEGKATQRRITRVLSSALLPLGISGAVAQLIAAKRLNASASSFALSGLPAGLFPSQAYELLAEAYALSLSAPIAELLAGRFLVGGLCALSLIGLDATLSEQQGGFLVASLGVLTAGGNAVGLLIGRSLYGSTLGLALSSSGGAILRHSRRIAPATSSFSLAGNNTILERQLPMSATFVDAQVANATSVAIPSHQIGDLLLIFAFRNGGNSVPATPAASGTVPAWAPLSRVAGSDSASANISYFVATATNHTSGTWSNANTIIAAVYRGAALGTQLYTIAKSATVSYPSISLTRTDGTSLVLGFGGSKTASTASMAVSPSGMSNRITSANTPAAALHDTSSGVSSWLGGSITASANDSYITFVLELVSTNRNLLASVRGFAISGRDVGFIKNSPIAASTGVFSLVGLSTSLSTTAVPRLLLSPGAFDLQASGVALLKQWRLLTATQAYSISLAPAALLHGRRIPCASYALTLFFPLNSLTPSNIVGGALARSPLRSRVQRPMDDVTDAINRIELAYNPIAPTNPSFLRPRYVVHNTHPKAKDLGLQDHGEYIFVGSIGTESGTNTLYCRVQVTAPRKLGIRISESTSQQRRWISVGILDETRRPVPQALDGFALAPASAYGDGREETYLSPAGVYYFTITTSQWKSHPVQAEIFVLAPRELVGVASLRLEGDCYLSRAIAGLALLSLQSSMAVIHRLAGNPELALQAEGDLEIS